jgi:thymidine kinase
VGLSAKAEIVPAYFDLVKAFLARKPGETSVIIIDEAQFLTPEQVDQLRLIVDDYDVPVMCFGLRTDFLTHMFPGSKRLMEVAESITEIKTICACGAKAIVNARLDAAGNIVTSGEQVFLGGNESYVAMCHRCWRNKIKSQQE